MPITRRLLSRAVLYATLSIAAPLALAAPTAPAGPAADAVPVLDRISATAMRGNLAFLASDALEGRGTPSRGLDIAAEFIASQFRAAGLEPLGDEPYFQTAAWSKINPRRDKNAAPAAPVKVRNVVGILRGSDPALKDSYILVTAHYDHVGLKPGEGDGIFNGANDDGSGTVSVIELAKAFGAQKQRPKRSIVFMTVFGEEHGLVGSRYYGANPLVPIEKTVAGINLEQVGRTDDSEGPQQRAFAVTGYDFSDIGEILKKAGEQTGIKVWKHPVNSDKYFAHSDNQALADQGIPAHTVSVAYAFPDYHGAGDHWDKIDYENMAAVNRTVALAIWNIANSSEAPKWNKANPKAAKYLTVQEQRR